MSLLPKLLSLAAAVLMSHCKDLSSQLLSSFFLSGSKGSDSLLSKVMAAFARPTRLCNSQKIDSSTDVDAQLFELEEERQLQVAFQQVASKVRQNSIH